MLVNVKYLWVDLNWYLIKSIWAIPSSVIFYCFINGDFKSKDSHKHIPHILMLFLASSEAQHRTKLTIYSWITRRHFLLLRKPSSPNCFFSIKIFTCWCFVWMNGELGWWDGHQLHQSSTEIDCIALLLKHCLRRLMCLQLLYFWKEDTISRSPGDSSAFSEIFHRLRIMNFLHLGLTLDPISVIVLVSCPIIFQSSFCNSSIFHHTHFYKLHADKGGNANSDK